MRIRRLLGILLVLPLLGICLWEVYRGGLVLLFQRGHYAQVERWGGDAFFAPALRHYFAHSPPGVESRIQICEWVQHRYCRRFPDETLYNLDLLQTGELALLLRATEESKRRSGLGDECRIVILDPDHGDLLVAASERIDHDGWRMRWQGDWVFLDGGGTMVISLAYHREGSSLHLLPARMNVQGEPYFWGFSEFEDLDGDGIPEVVGDGGARESCPGCGRDLVPREEIWKLIDGAYQLWTVEESRCPSGCKFPRSD